MTNKSPAFQFYPESWISDARVIAMSPEEEGHYIRLCGICWLEGSLPSDPEEIQGLLKCRCETLEKVLKCFYINPRNNSQLLQKKLEKEKKKQRAFRKQKSSAGKKGASKRWENKGLGDKSKNGTAIVLPLAKNSSLVSVSDSVSISISKSKDLKDIGGKNLDQPNPKENAPGDSELQNLWGCTLEAIESKIEPDDFKRWFLSTHARTLEDGKLTVAVPNQNNRKVLIEKYRGEIEDTLEIIEGNRITVDFCVQR